MKQWDEDNEQNLNNHGGYQIKDLFVAPKYSTFKHELMNYSDLDIANYHKTILPKLKQYMQTRIFKSIYPDIPYDNHVNYVYNFRVGFKDRFTNNDQQLAEREPSQDLRFNAVKLAYGIWREPMSEEHLLSIILYCDYSRLCTTFSASFRPLNPFEPLSSIKDRNRNFYWLSRRLRECVQIYGDRLYDEDSNHENRRKILHTGISFETILPAFSIRFCAPTSTSLHKEVAVKFAGPKGTLITISPDVNERYHDRFIRAFSCSWISQSKEESEYLTMGGHYRASISSIITISNARNYGLLCPGLKKLDALLSEQINDYDRMSNVEYNILESLLCKYGNLKIQDSDINLPQISLDKYTLDTFNHYRRNKNVAILNLPKLDDIRHKEENHILSYVMEELQYNTMIAHNSEYNLPRSEFFHIFPNITHIQIHTVQCDRGKDSFDRSWMTWHWYEISIDTLLSLLKGIRSFKQCKVIGIRLSSHEPSGLFYQWHAKSDAFMDKCKEQGMEINFELRLNEDNKRQPEDILIISK